MIIIVMGVSGSGKSTVAKTVASRCGLLFADADEYHSSENLQKMAAGLALDDEDRMPWLESLRVAIKKWLDSEQTVLLACSALKKSYREILRVDPDKVKFVYLKGSYELFHRRLAARKQHFMQPSMLAGQFETLEEPGVWESLVCNAFQSPFEIAEEIIAEYAL